jgi:hypothetical protein
MVVQLPHECFLEEMRENPHAAEGPLDPEWTEQYRQHPVVLRNQVATVMPYAFYLDGISFTNSDSLLGMIVYSLHRHLCCVIRRSNFCCCGCKGYPIFAVLKWSFDCLAQRTWPTKSHSGDWAATGSSEAAAGQQPVRPRLAGTPLGFHGALLHVKGDWDEFAHTLGFADWNSELFCCLFCKATRANRYDIAGSRTTTWNGLVVGVNSGGPCLGQTMLGYEQTSTTTSAEMVHSVEPSSLTCRSCNC